MIEAKVGGAVCVQLLALKMEEGAMNQEMQGTSRSWKRIIP